MGKKRFPLLDRPKKKKKSLARPKGMQMQQGGRRMEGEAKQEWGVGQADMDGTLAGGKRRRVGI